jgi:hypothetical protein
VAARAAERRARAHRRWLAKRAAQNRRERGRKALDPIWQSDRAMLVVDELLAAAELASEPFEGEHRATIRAAVVRLAHAEGREDTRQRAVELAAAAIRWAGALTPGNDVDGPDRDLESIAEIPADGCQALTRKGTPCEREPIPGLGYCPSHTHLADLEAAA